jgi:hypothetical protein
MGLGSCGPEIVDQTLRKCPAMRMVATGVFGNKSTQRGSAHLDDTVRIKQIMQHGER